MTGVGFGRLLRRDLLLVLRQGGDALLTLAFYLLAVAIFPFGVGPEPQLLARIAGGLLWTMALFAALLSFDRLFQQELEDGGWSSSPSAPCLLPGASSRRRWPIGWRQVCCCCWRPRCLRWFSGWSRQRSRCWSPPWPWAVRR